MRTRTNAHIKSEGVTLPSVCDLQNHPRSEDDLGVEKKGKNPRQCSARNSYDDRLKHCFLHKPVSPAGLKNITRFHSGFPAKFERGDASSVFWIIQRWVYLEKHLNEPASTPNQNLRSRGAAQPTNTEPGDKVRRVPWMVTNSELKTLNLEHSLLFFLIHRPLGICQNLLRD